MDSDLAWVNNKRAVDKADAMLTLSSVYNIGSHLPFLVLATETNIFVNVLTQFNFKSNGSNFTFN